MAMTGRVRLCVLSGGALICGLAATLLVSISPAVHFAYRSVPAHVSLETTNSIAAAVVAYLAYGRMQRNRDGHDVLLLAAFVLFGIADLFTALLPALLGEGIPSPFWTWVSLAVRLTAAGLFATAGGLQTPQRQGGWILIAVLVTMCVLMVTGVSLWLVQASLPVPVDPRLSPEVSGYPRIVGHPALLALQLVQVLFFSIASVGFLRRALISATALEMWIGTGAVLGAFARLNYFLFPSIYSQWIYTGDLLRTGFYLLLLVGAAAEVRSYWAAETEAAAFAERRRVARDLHDGAVQEIGLIRTLARRLAPSGSIDADHIVSAAERALAEVRGAITALSTTTDEPLVVTLERAAAELADRYDVALHVSLDGSVVVSPSEREALVRIVRESVQNAVRHAEPREIQLELRGGPPRRLVVRDDGRGFDRADIRVGSFGLQSMRDRAEGIGGTLQIGSAPARGTTVEVTW